MRFKCSYKSCDKEFVYPAKITIQRGMKAFGPDVSTNAVPTPLPAHDVLEKQVCPYCLSLTFDELPKDTKGTNDNVTEVVSVPHREVAAKIKEGYKVYGIYASSTVLVKRNLNET